MENHQLENQQINFYNDPEEDDNNNNNNVLPGFRFKPYDAELLEHYLLKLVFRENSPEGLRIPVVDLYNYTPQELTAKYKEQCENEWYFFTQRNRKYAGGNRPDRGAGFGFWKQTNVPKPVFKVQEDKTSVELGRKVTLDYYDKSKNEDGDRTNWKMIEYRVNEKLPNLPSNYNSDGTSTELYEWCLCRIYISARTVNKTNKVGQGTLQANNEFTSGTNFVQQNIEHTIAAQEYSEQVVAEADPNFVRQNLAPLFSDHHIIAQQEYTEQSAGGLDSDSFQQSTTPFINDTFSNSINSFYLVNTIDGPMDGMSYNNDYYGLIDHEETYPVTDQLHDNDFVQPIRSLPTTGLPVLPHSNFNQNSSSSSGDVTRGSEDGSLFSLVFGNGQGSSNGHLKMVVQISLEIKICRKN